MDTFVCMKNIRFLADCWTDLRQPSCRASHPYSSRACVLAVAEIQSSGPGLSKQNMILKLSIESSGPGLYKQTSVKTFIYPKCPVDEKREFFEFI